MLNDKKSTNKLILSLNNTILLVNVLKSKLMALNHLVSKINLYKSNLDFASLPFSPKRFKVIDIRVTTELVSVQFFKLILNKIKAITRLEKDYLILLAQLQNQFGVPLIKNQQNKTKKKKSILTNKKGKNYYSEFMLFLKKRKNNFYINLHLYTGKLLYTNSVGKVHFRGPKRSTLYGLEELAKKTSTFLFQNKINFIRIFITSKVNKKINRVIKLLKYNYPKLRYIINKVIKYQHSAGLKLKKLRRI